MKRLTAVLIVFVAHAAAGQPVTQPSAPIYPPWIPPVAQVEPLPPTARKPRVFFDYNITPIFLKNPKWVNENGREPDRNGRFQYDRNTEAAEYMLKSGAFTPAPVVYNAQVAIREAIVSYASAAGTIDPKDFHVVNWQLTRAGTPVF